MTFAEAVEKAQKASAEYTKVLRENTNAKYENIKTYYDTRRSWDDAYLSKFDIVTSNDITVSLNNDSCL